MTAIFAGIAIAVAAALVARAVNATVAHLRGWYRDSLAGSVGELVVLAALIGGLAGVLYQRMRG